MRMSRGAQARAQGKGRRQQPGVKRASPAHEWATSSLPVAGTQVKAAKPASIRETKCRSFWLLSYFLFREYHIYIDGDLRPVSEMKRINSVQGVMSEALTAALAWMKSNNPNIEIVIKIPATNTVSWQLAEKVGFKSVGFYQIDGVTIMMYSSNPQGVEE